MHLNVVVNFTHDLILNNFSSNKSAKTLVIQRWSLVFLSHNNHCFDVSQQYLHSVLGLCENASERTPWCVQMWNGRPRTMILKDFWQYLYCSKPTVGWSNHHSTNLPEIIKLKSLTTNYIWNKNMLRKWWFWQILYLLDMFDWND